MTTVKVANRTDAPVRRKTGYKKWRPQLVPRIIGSVGRSVGKTELVDVSHRVLCSSRLVRFVEMEYAIPRAEATTALLRIRDLVEGEGLRVDFPVELRVAAADDIPLSTASGRETAYLAVHVSSGTPFEGYFRGVEAIMDELGGRPHWGKMHFQTAATLAPRYPEWDRFQAVRARLDPDGRFRNAYLDRVLGPLAGAAS
jgi:FAD/FMN-containing dehydrogenase